MAKRTDFVKGVSIDQILKMPLNELKELTDSQLKVLVGRGVSAGNKRIRRYEKEKGELPFAGKEGGQYSDIAFSTVGKDRQELMEEFKRLKQFMFNKTSSLQGQAELKRATIKAFEGTDENGNNRVNINVDLNNVNYDRFWKAYEKLKELNPEVADKNFKYEVMEKLYKRVQGKKWFNVDKAVIAIDKQLKTIYEARELVRTAKGTAGFYDVTSKPKKQSNKVRVKKSEYATGHYKKRPRRK